MPPGDPAARPSNFGSASVVTVDINRSLSMRRLPPGCAATRVALRIDAAGLERPATWNQIAAVATTLEPMILRLIIASSS